MFISFPWDAVQPVAPALPDEPAAASSPTNHLPPFSDPASPKYHAPAVIFVGSLVGLVVLIGALILLWRSRKKLFTRNWVPKWARQAITAARAISLPMPASAYLCGWLRVPTPVPGNRSPPPPYDEQRFAPGSPALPPGLLPSQCAASSASACDQSAPSPPATYPPAPPPTPDNEVAATAATSPISSTTAPASDLLANIPAPVASVVVQSTHDLAAPGPPPTYPPPPLPESRRFTARGVGPYAQEACAVPWGSVEASTPRTSSVLARCGYEP